MTDSLEVALRIARALERASVPYALGGALAYGLYGVPRATVDVDVNTFLEPRDLGPVFDVLETLGVSLDRGDAIERAEREGMFSVQLEGCRVDLFTPSIDFSWEADRSRVRHAIEGEEIWFLSAEALCVFKLLFFRGKDVVDLERLIAVQSQGGSLDSSYVRDRIAEIMGEDDERVQTWDRLIREFGQS